jgi:hypothetical protein
MQKQQNLLTDSEFVTKHQQPSLKYAKGLDQTSAMLDESYVILKRLDISKDL